MSASNAPRIVTGRLKHAVTAARRPVDTLLGYANALLRSADTLLESGDALRHAAPAATRAAKAGAAVGAITLAVALAAFAGWRTRPVLGPIGDIFLAGAAGLGAIAVIALATALLLRVVRRLPPLLTGTLVGATAVLTYVLVLPGRIDDALGATAVALVALLGALVGAATLGEAGARPAARRAAFLTAVAAAAAVAWVAWPGSVARKNPPPAIARAVAPLDAPNPSLPGPYDVKHLTYGSGTDRMRAEYGSDVDLVTAPVNASPYVRWSGLRKRLLEWRWGFDTTRLPLNARVWYPDGAGPFPLVLVVHGNHELLQFSDPGYSYLGELLASRGYIVASVDENFLNGGVYGSSSGENDARSWLLLKHLEAWRDWNETPGNPFTGRVDMERIALIGHSRGGEAVATAATFNQLPHHPENALRPFDFGFGIRSVIAFAPSDGQYEPGGRLNELSGVSYLAFHGADDSDVSNFSGLRQFARLDLGSAVAPGRPQRPFKAALYLDRANHGQFNSVWGNRDQSAPAGWLLNTATLMPESEQQRLAATYVSAFLEDTLRGDDRYRPLFRDFAAGAVAGWLPETDYVSRYADPGFRIVADFEEDVDSSTASLVGASIRGSGFGYWREKLLEFRTGKSQETRAVALGWSAPGASYTLSLPPGLANDWGLTADSLLVLAVAEADQSPPGRPAQADADTEGETAGGIPLDLTIEITDSSGASSAVPLSEHGVVPRPIRSTLTKLPAWESRRYRNDTQPILGSVEVPLAAFIAQEPNLDPTGLSSIRLRFDRSPEGVILIDDIGFDVDG
ncbi:MAG: MFS transporter [Anaerolineae bacterium]